MAKKKKTNIVQSPEYTPYDVSGTIPADAFAVLGADTENMEAIKRPSISFMKDAWNRIRKSKVAVVCMIFLAIIILGAIFFPMVIPFDYAKQNVAFQNQPMFTPDSVTGQMHIFGTDALGRDVFARIWYGARVSLTVAVAVALIDCVIGVIYGGVFRRNGRQRDDAYPRGYQRYSLYDHRNSSDDSHGSWNRDDHHCVFSDRMDRYGTACSRPGGEPEGAGICHCRKNHGSRRRAHYRETSGSQCIERYHCQHHTGYPECYLHRGVPVHPGTGYRAAEGFLGNYRQRRDQSIPDVSDTACHRSAVYLYHHAVL